MAIIVGHRGAAGYATENTIASFIAAIEIGCDRTELVDEIGTDFPKLFK